MVRLTTLPDLIASARLRLPLVSPDEAADMLAGRRRPEWHAHYPRPDDVDAASMARPGDAWGPRHIVRSFDGLVVGSIGCFGPPDDASGTPEAEVGFGLVPDARGHGAATEALRALLAETDELGVRVRARVRPGNAASLRVLAKCGFTELRGSDGDGQLVLARRSPRAGS